jgi:hypothetical protein
LPHKAADRLEEWYAGGEKGMLTICDNEDAPQSVKDAVRHWYKEGRKRFDVLVGIVRELEDEHFKRQ